ncbi:recombination-associated protein RdgC [Geothrix fermentans]|jgi:DNA recombination-dependent growth factor C|uniref:recombination-associated protein RdgC n=1 Tax=Geothrix fermentans TaxID=44676 RepID=UPI00040409B2|nr:recombination-associated protein RdgC [Geothrix fermentans]
MSILQGTVSLKRFLVLGPVPDPKDLQAGLAQDQFRPFQDGMEEERIGWCDWRNPLITPPDEDWVSQERFAVFGLRIDTRRVPPALLKAHVDLRLQTLQKEKDLAFIGKEARISLQDEVKLELLRKVLPTPKVVEVAWDLKGGILWTTASSSKAQGALASIFIKSFGCEIHPLAPLVLAGRLSPELSVEGLMALDPLDLELEEA